MARTNKNGRHGTKATSPLAVIFNIIGTVMIVAVIAVGLITVVPKVTGNEIYNVLTGSMEPNIPVGSMIVVSDCDPAELKEGDVITFARSGDGEVVTHRVVKNDTDAAQIITKGDANEQEDMDPVEYVNVRGLVKTYIPHLGSALTITSTMMGKIALICLALCGLLLTVIAGKLR